MKNCPRCGQRLPTSKFDMRGKADRRLRAYCRPCNTAYQRHYYRRHVAQYSAHRLKNMRLYRARNQQLVTRYLSMHPCVDCGEGDVAVLEFDHVRGKKISNVANMVRDGVRWIKIEQEIAKCEVRCANCHRRKTAKQMRYKAGAARLQSELALLDPALSRMGAS